LFPGLLREFLYQIDLIVLLSRIAPARCLLSADKIFPTWADNGMMPGKRIFTKRIFIENNGNRGRKFLSL
jgi:hypothetical protein